MPPVVRSKAVLQANSPTKHPIVTFYDAIEALRADEGGDGELDPELANFASMVDDYLQRKPCTNLFLPWRDSDRMAHGV